MIRKLTPKEEARKVGGSTKRAGNRGLGRKPGVPNKATAKCREAIAMIADDMTEDFKAWIRATAEGRKLPAEDGEPEKWLCKPDPYGAASLYLAAIEYHIPKLARTEATIGTKDDKPLDLVIRLVHPDDKKKS